LLIELFSLVRELASEYKRANSLFGVIKIEEFKEILKPFKWVDWKDKELEATYPGSGEKGRRSLEVWMADALIQGLLISMVSEFHIFSTLIISAIKLCACLVVIGIGESL
jgi:hypothetical protein